MKRKRKRNVNPDPHRMKSITWRDGAEKDQVMELLNSPSIRKMMPQKYHGNAGKMVLWAAKKVKESADAEKQNSDVITSEFKALKARIVELEKLEKGYVITYNNLLNGINEKDNVITNQNKLLRLYRSVARSEHLTVDEERGTYKGKYDDYWTVPPML